jgi:mevalonate kinase
MVRASAPGKCILMGEHAAVYGRPALVAAIDRRLYATVVIRDGGTPGVELRLPDLGVEERVGWRQLAEYAGERRRLWEEARAGADPALFAKVRGEDRAHLVKAALGELLLFAGIEPEVAARVEIASELPLGSGFGSSAACATALLLAASTALGIGLHREQLFELALEAERRQHGAPSGVDNATVLHGGILWVEKDPGGKIVTMPLATQRKPLLPGLRFFQSGEPAESTGAVVAAVKALRAEDPAAFEARLDDMAAATRELREQLEAEEPASPIELFRRFESHLEAIGVVPPELQKVVREIESQGGAAKISGAGSLKGPGAGSLLVLEGRGALDIPFKELELELGAAGARLE